MTLSDLKKSDVIFNPGPHTYTTKDGCPLSGVTAILNRHMFAHKYDNIPAFVLAKAAEYGTAVHERIQLCDSLGVVPEDDNIIEAYNRFKSEIGVQAIANEYLVSDGVNVASSIDIVFDDLSLCDTKTTSKLDKDFLSWQLSIYAYLFEFQNPGLKVPRLFALWLPKKQYGKPALVEIERIPSQECARLIECDAMGIEYTPQGNDVIPACNGEIVVRDDVVRAVIDFEMQIKKLTEQRDELKKGLMSLMTDNGITSWTSTDGQLSLTVRKGGERVSVDTRKLKEDHPLIYEKYFSR